MSSLAGFGSLGFNNLAEVGRRVLVLLPISLCTGEESSASVGVFLQSSERARDPCGRTLLS